MTLNRLGFSKYDTCGISKIS